MHTVAFLLQCIMVLVQLLRVTPGGTTENLEEIFMGRCWEFQRLVNPTVFTEDRNCSQLWSSFYGAWGDREPCDVTMEAYTEYTEAALHYVGPNEHMLWEGVYPFVYDYTALGRRGVGISDTLTGYVVNGMDWCGSTSDGINYTDCPAWGACNEAADLSFWRAVSVEFAKLAEGEVRVMLNGSNGRAYNPESVFAEDELPNLDPNKVTLVHALVVHDLDKPVRESCENGTLVDLQRAVGDFNLTYKCTNDPEDVLHLLCVDHPDAPECVLESPAASCSHTASISTMLFFVYFTLFGQLR